DPDFSLYYATPSQVVEGCKCVPARAVCAGEFCCAPTLCLSSLWSRATYLRRPEFSDDGNFGSAGADIAAVPVSTSRRPSNNPTRAFCHDPAKAGSGGAIGKSAGLKSAVIHHGAPHGHIPWPLES